MKTFQIRLLCLLSVLQFIFPQLFAGEIFVATDGSDQNPGTEASPVATLRHARDLTRQLQGQPKRITIKPGIYYNVSVLLEPQDSGLEIQGAQSKGSVVLVGGSRVTDWKSGENGWLQAKLPAYPDGQLDFPTPSRNWEIRALSVSGHWRPNSRIPHTGYLKTLNRWDVAWRGTAEGGWASKPTENDLTLLKYREGDFAEGTDFGSAEVTVFHKWDTSDAGITEHDPASRTLRLAKNPTHPLGAFGITNYIISNTREGLTSPGQWYHDRVKGILYYNPKEGESAGDLNAFVPAALTIIGIQGTPKNRVRNIRISDLHLDTTTSQLGPGGPIEGHRDGALSYAQVEGLQLDRLVVRHTGGWALKGSKGVAGLQVRNCVIYEVGAGGIYSGSSLRTVIANNSVGSVGLTYPAAPPIVGQGFFARIVSNKVENCNYSGIWYESGREAEIAWNSISNSMNIMRDGGAIYTTFSTNSSIHNNFITDVHEPGPDAACGIYLDEGSSACLVENNYITATTWAIHGHGTTNSIVRNNYFSAPNGLRFYFQNCDGWTFEKNILSTPGRILIESTYREQPWRNNLLERPEEKTITAVYGVMTANGLKTRHSTNSLATGSVYHQADGITAKQLSIHSFATPGAAYRQGNPAN